MFRMLIAAGIIFGAALVWVWIQRQVVTENRTHVEGSCASCGERGTCQRQEPADSCHAEDEGKESSAKNE